MPSDSSTPTDPSSQQASSRFQDAVSRGVQSKVHQLIKAGVLRPARTNEQCGGIWKPRYSISHTDARIIIIDASPRMNLIDDPSSPNIIVIFELPGVRNENITLEIKDGRFIIIGSRDDPSAEALVAAKASIPISPDSGGDFGGDSGGTDANLDPHDSENSLKDDTDDSVVTSSVKPFMDGSIRELRYGSFLRSIALPEGIKVSPDIF